MRVLLVDDDNVFNFLSRRMLELMDVKCVIDMARNGREALSFVNESISGNRQLPDLILLDLNMPIMNGFEFLEAFRQITVEGIENIKIVIVTSSPHPKDIERAKSFGVNQYLTKPLLEDRLRSILN